MSPESRKNGSGGLPAAGSYGSAEGARLARRVAGSDHSQHAVGRGFFSFCIETSMISKIVV